MKPAVCAVSFLNTTPLIWGLQHGPERELIDLSLAIPSECAARLADGRADVGLVPVIEFARQKLRQVGDLGIAADGAVRSILLISRVPFSQIRTLAVDRSSRTSVVLAQLVLQHRYGCRPELTAFSPDLDSMLREHDAALLIGDSALRVEPATLPYYTLDLGQAWTEWTGLPMVFAIWASPETFAGAAGLAPILRNSYNAGQQHLAEIIEREATARHFPHDVVATYLRHQIHYEIGPRYSEGLAHFLHLARAINEA